MSDDSDGTNHEVAGLVLAAGASRRMGEPKPLLSLGGRSYLETVVRTLVRARLEPVAVVLGSRAERIWSAGDYPGAVRVDNPDWERGMAFSWRCGLRALASRSPRASAAVVALVDVPRFRLSTVRRLVDAHRGSGAPVVVPRHGGRRGHPVLVGRALWPAFEQPPAGGAREILHADPGAVLEVDVDDAWILQDADTPADHRRMLVGWPERVDPGAD